jgi:5-methylcytosine-specific restriction enzyme B
MFDWIPLYKEIGVKLLEFENRQSDLIGLLRELREKGLSVVSLIDKTGHGEIELAEIDPFTFFASFNRKQADDTRKQILSELKSRWALGAPVPTDFEGVPVVNNQQSWFFAYSKRRGTNDIPQLWKLAKESIEKDATTFDPQILQNCIAIKMTNLAKLTMGCFG